MAAEKKEDNTKQLAGVLAVILLLGVGFKMRSAPKSKKIDSTRAGAASEPAAGAAAGGGGGDPSFSQPTETAQSIPELSPEIRRKLEGKKGRSAVLYSKEKLEGGINPFIPLSVTAADLDRKSSAAAASGPRGAQRKKLVFTGKMIFWGAFSAGPDDPKRAIIEVVGQPQPWTGAEGEAVEGTPYVLHQIMEGDRAVKLINPTSQNDPPVIIPFKDEAGRPTKGAPGTGSAGAPGLFRDAAPGAAAGGAEPLYDR